MDRLAFPASSDVKTSCPMERKASTICSSTFSFVYKRATTHYAASFS